MKTSLGFLTEEGRTRSKNTFRRVFGYAALMLVAGAASAYGIHRYWIRSNLTPLQRALVQTFMKDELVPNWSLAPYAANTASHS